MSGLVPRWLRRLPTGATGEAARRLRVGLAIAVAILLPLALLASVLAAGEARQSVSASFAQRLADLAQTAADQIDTQLSVYRTAAEVMARSPELQEGGLPGVLYEQAWSIGQQLGGWIMISSAEAGRAQVVNTQAPQPQRPRVFRDDEPRGIDETLRTRQVSVSDLDRGYEILVPRVMVSAPTFVNGQVRYVVSVIVLPEQLSRLLARLPLPEGGYAVLVDGRQRIVGRSADAQPRVGMQASEWSSAPMDGDQALVTSRSRQGVESLFAVHRIASVPGWRVAVAMPIASAESVVAMPFQWVSITRTAVVVLVLIGGLLGWTSWRETRDSYRQLDRVLAHAPAMIGVNRVWPDGRFERAFLSRSAEQLTGWPHEALIRMGSLTPLMTPQGVEELREHMRLTLSGTGQTFEHPLRRPDGTSRRMRASLALVERHADGSGTVASCILDITDLHVTEQRLRLLEKLAVLGEVSSGIAHELNQPLAAIAMAAENGDRALRRTPPNLRLATEKFMRITAQAHRMSAIIDHVRALSREEGGRSELLDIAVVVHEALVLLEGRLAGAELELDIDIPARLPPVRGVAVLLEQVLLNVIGNACDAYQALHRPGPHRLHIAAAPVGDTLVLRIADQAGGVPDGLQQRIFEPFFTTKPVGKGTGLGLSISLASVVEMGGQMSVRNEAGGACFEIVLPVATTADLAVATSVDG